MTHGTWQIDQLWYDTSILRFRIFYCKKKKNGKWVHKRVRVRKFEYINEYGLPFHTRVCTQNLEYTVWRPVLVYVLIFLRSWLNIDGTYGRVTLSVKVCRCPSTPGSDRPGSDHAKPKSHTKTKGVKFESSHFQGADCWLPPLRQCSPSASALYWQPARLQLMDHFFSVSFCHFPVINQI